MGKSLYSLILSDEVINEIDVMAHLRGTNRSGLINRILSEYTMVQTPESRVNDIFRTLEQIISENRELVPYFIDNRPCISVKSSLQYKYRPTVKYEITLDRSGESRTGELAVIFRTVSENLLREMTGFFVLWREIERRRPDRGAGIEYALYEGRFTRSIVLPADRAMTTDSTAKALSEYVKLFDRAMKAYLSGSCNGAEIGEMYDRYLSEASMQV